MLALVLALGAALTGAPAREPPAAEAMPLIWGTAEGVVPYGLPPGVGQIVAIHVTGNTVFVLSDVVAGDGFIEVIRSDDGGYSWAAANAIPVAFPAATGVAIVASPSYGNDGTVLVLASDGIVYLSQNRGVTWPFVTVALADAVTSLAVAPNFDGLTAGTIAVGVARIATLSTVHLNTWAGAPAIWGGWAPLNPMPGGVNTPAAPSATLAVAFAPEAAYSNWVVTVTFNAATARLHSYVTPIGGLWPAPAAANTINPAPLPIGAATDTAVIAFGADYNPTVNPLRYFIGLTGTNPGVWWEQTLLAWVNIYAATTVPVGRWPTSGLVATGSYARATLIAGVATFPLTYKIDVRSGIVDPPVFIEGDGGPIGAVSGTVGVLLAYRGTGNTVFAATVDFVGGFTAGDLTGLHRSDSFADSWFDTCLTGEDFRQNVNDMAWLDGRTGIIVCDDGTAPYESVFKTWDTGISWKRVDRRMNVTLLSVAPDGTIYLLNTGNTSTKVLSSTDDGDSFTATAIDPTIASVILTAIAGGSATDIVVGSINGRIIYSGDGGASWTDVGQQAARIVSLWVPDNYDTVNHVGAGVTSLAGLPEVLLSTDAGASWTQVGTSTQVGAWGPWVAPPPVGYIGGAFSPTYGGSPDDLLYVHTVGAVANDIYRTDTSGDLATAGYMPLGAGVAIAAIDMVHYAAIADLEAYTGNILYATGATVGPAGTIIATPGGVLTTYSPEIVNYQFPFTTFWDAFPPDAGSNFARNGVLDAVVGSSIDLFAADWSDGSGQAWSGIDRVRTITETTGYLTPPALRDPIGGAIVPSNDRATGEPVEVHWGLVVAALTYDPVVATSPSRLDAVWRPVFGIGTPAVPAGVIATEGSVPTGTLADGQTYYWQVRVNSTLWGVHFGPWSDWQSFTVEAVELHVAPTLIKPVAAAVDVAVRPLFQWSGIEDATNFQLQVDDDATFGSPVIDETLGVQQTYQPAVALDWEETYSWRVKGIGLDWETPWSESIFVTIPEWAEPSPAVTPVWVWIVIVLGAIVAIVVIVLIVRTRRPV